MKQNNNDFREKVSGKNRNTKTFKVQQIIPSLNEVQMKARRNCIVHLKEDYPCLQKKRNGFNKIKLKFEWKGLKIKYKRL